MTTNQEGAAPISPAFLKIRKKVFRNCCGGEGVYSPGFESLKFREKGSEIIIKDGNIFYVE